MVLTNALASQRGELTRLRLARGSNDLVDVEVPAGYLPDPVAFPNGDPMNVGLAYSQFATAIREDRAPVPGFEEAVDLHELLDTIVESSESKSEALR